MLSTARRTGRNHRPGGASRSSSLNRPLDRRNREDLPTLELAEEKDPLARVWLDQERVPSRKLSGGYLDGRLVAHR